MNSEGPTLSPFYSREEAEVDGKNQEQIFLEYHSEKYQRLVENIAETPVKIEQKIGCNQGRFWICITDEQFKSILDHFFEKKSKQADDFIEYCRKQPVCDGLIFSITSPILKKCREEPENYALKYCYLINFGFVGDGIFIKPEEYRNYYSKYPLTFD